MKNKIGKLFLTLLVANSCFFATSCSTKYEAERIFNSNLTKKEKIDKLIRLYLDKSTENSSYNQAVNDRAWKAICNGQYDKAVSILGGYKSEGNGQAALYYIYELQDVLPPPDDLEFIIRTNGKHTKWDWKLSYPYVDTYLKLDIAYKIKIQVEHGAIYLHNPEEGSDPMLHNGHRFEYWDDYTGTDYNVTFEITPLAPSILDYYKSPETPYKYTFSCDLNNLVDGQYKCDFIG